MSAFRSRIHRFVFAAMFLLAALYLAAQIAPSPAFAFSAGEGRFILHSDRPIAAAELDSIQVAAKRIQACPFDDLAMRHDVFVCRDAGRLRFFTPISHGALGVTNVFGNSFVRSGPKRSLASLITHERVHAMLARRYGRLWSFFTPDWKQEGVCEYIAGDISYDVEVGKSMLLAGKFEDSGPFQYFKYWFAVRHLVDVEGLTLVQVLDTTMSEAEVLKVAVEALRKHESKPR